MRRRIVNSLRAGRNFKNEFRRQIRMLIVITLGFTIAFTWRQTIFDISTSMVKFFTNIQDSATLSILASLLITIISVVIIYLTAYFLKDNSE